MQTERAWKCRDAGINSNVLSSLIIDLVTHHQHYGALDHYCIDWQSPSRRTRVVCYTNRCSLYNVLHQVPDAVVAEYQLNHRDEVVHAWCEYQWPHLQCEQTSTDTDQQIHIPRNCLAELLQFHVEADTGWLTRYRQRLRRIRDLKINEVGVVTESDRFQ